MNTTRASLQFFGYHVDKMVFNAKPNFNSEDTQIELQPSFSRTIQQINADEYEVTIGVELKQNNLPFIAELAITGKFKYDGSLDADKMLKINAVAIMYPYVRATLSMMTTLAAVPPVIIPTINLAQMFEKEDAE